VQEQRIGVLHPLLQCRDRGRITLFANTSFYDGMSPICPSPKRMSCGARSHAALIVMV